jgi:hypothetical protein
VRTAERGVRSETAAAEGRSLRTPNSALRIGVASGSLPSE